MRTVSGFGRQIGRVLSRLRSGRSAPVALVAATTPTVERRPLISDRLGEQRHAGAVLDQVDGTTCGSAVLLALAAWADPAEVTRLDASGEAKPLLGAGFGTRYDARQKEVHGQTNRFWPQALGTTPWGAVRWLRDHAPAAGRYRVRLVDDTSAADVSRAVGDVAAALAAGRPVPLLVGSAVPRHYVLALRTDGPGWRVYEPTSGQVRLVDLAVLRERRSGPLLGFDRWHAALLPS